MKFLSLNTLKNLPSLYMYFKLKKMDYVNDYTAEWWEGVDRKDKEVFKLPIHIESVNKVGVFLFYDADKIYEKKSYGLKFDLERFENEKPIRQCTFKEYVEIYGELVISMNSKQ